MMNPESLRYSPLPTSGFEEPHEDRIHSHVPHVHNHTHHKRAHNHHGSGHTHDHGHGNSDDHGGHSDNHSHDSCCDGHESLGWRQFLPHSHGLTSRLAGDRRALTLSLAVVTFTCVLQFIAGTVAWSSVLITEAVHSALDGLSVVLALIAVTYASGSPTPHMTYGYARTETLAAGVSILMLGMLCVKLFLGALERLWHALRGSRAPLHVEGSVVFAAEAVTLASNLLMVLVLNKLGKHNADGDEESSLAKNPEEMSLNLRALRAHILADSVENLVVLFAGMLMWLVPAASIIDPILTLAIAALLVYLNAPIAREVAHVILQGTPLDFDVEDAVRALSRIPGAVSCGDVHVWTLTSNTHVATATIYVAKDTSSETVESVRVAGHRVLRKLGAAEATVEVARSVLPAPHVVTAGFGTDTRENFLSPLEIEMDDLEEDIDIEGRVNPRR